MLPEVERVLFKNSPLRLVIGQIRFPLLLRFSEGAFIAPFQEALAVEYPVVTREQQVSFQVSEKGLQSGGENQFRFSSRDGLWAVVFGEGALTLEVKGYSSIDVFSSRFKMVLSAAREHLLIRERARLGLRYINEFRHESCQSLSDWSKLLRPELLGFVATDLLGGPVKRMFQEIQVTRPDGILAIRHGLLAGTLVAATAPPPTEHFYLLDMDYFDARQEELDIEAITNTLCTYNDVMYRFFRWCLLNTLFKYLEPEYAR